MKKINKMISVVSLTLLSLPAYSKSIGDEVKEQIQQRDITLRVPNIDLLTGESYSLEANARISIMPNRDLETYSRSEKLSIPLTFFKDANTDEYSVGIYNQNSFEAEFIRQFPSQIEAINLVKNPPLGLARIPRTAKNAMKMTPGDYYRYQAKMTIGLNGEHAVAGGISTARLGIDYLLYGDFQIEVYRLDNNQVLVRASSLKQKTVSVSAGLNKNFTLKLFEMSFLNKQANKLIPDKFVEVVLASNAKGNLFSVEYIFDLSNPQAAEAYNDMASPSHWETLDVIKVLNPLNGGNAKVKKILKMTINEAESISLADQKKSDDDARVRRVSRSLVDFRSRASGFKLNLLLVNLRDSANYVEQNFSLMSGPDEQEYAHYRIATTLTDEKFSGLFSGRKKYEAKREQNILFKLNENKAITSFEEINFSYERSDRRLKKEEVSSEVYKIVPGIYHKQKEVIAFIKALDQYRNE
ncbi:hypothetical protein K2X05_02750, partial [bacterium]|nr:hypothetical protein [bacterium]